MGGVRCSTRSNRLPLDSKQPPHSPFVLGLQNHFRAGGGAHHDSMGVFT